MDASTSDSQPSPPNSGTVMPSCFACNAISADLGVIAGNKNRVGIGRLDGGELRVEILVAAAVILFRRDLAAAGGETVFLEKFARPTL
jgi:hypothetical protein